MACRESDGVRYVICPKLTNEVLNGLFAASWPGHVQRDFRPILAQSMAWVCGYVGAQLVGFVNLASDGERHAFLLDTTVHPDWRRRGIGTWLVGLAADAARQRGLKWLHVDFEPRLVSFYRGCGFGHTEAGLMHLGAGQGSERRRGCG
jgi:GNAT superfamily N-acetyltransferase